MIPDYPTPDLSVQLRELWKLSFGDDDVFLDHFFSTGFSPERCRCVVNEGRLLAALYWFDCQYQEETYAYLYAVATHPDFRHQGIIHYLLADTHQLLEQKGYAGALLVPGDEGLRKMYTSIGYQDCTTINTVVSASQPSDVLIHPVDREEYQKLRQNLLPKDGVIQEGACLKFLETQYKFYAGTGFVMCAAPKNDQILEAAEYLGNTDMIPGILCALGYAIGTFRIPGTTIPFAMLYPIKKEAAVPGYFGLAMD